LRLILLTLFAPLSLPLLAIALDCPEGTQLQGQQPPEGNELKCVLPDGALHGPYKYWYSNGQLMQFLHYDHNLEHGEQKSWWPNGQIMMDGISMNGKRYQGFRYWDINGKESALEFETIQESL
jgi:hypothetical protein